MIHIARQPGATGGSLAIVMGGHVRVGLEDAIDQDWSTKRLATNAGQIERVVRLAEAAGRKVATAEEARRVIGLAPKQIRLCRVE